MRSAILYVSVWYFCRSDTHGLKAPGIQVSAAGGRRVHSGSLPGTLAPISLIMILFQLYVSMECCKNNCLRLEESNFRLGGITLITRSVPFFRVPMRIAVSLVNCFRPQFIMEIVMQ